jgi:hypothetical protein
MFNFSLLFVILFIDNAMKFTICVTLIYSYDILGAGMLWKPKEAQKFVKIR